MKIKQTYRTLAYVLMLTTVIRGAFAYAHTSSQEGILAKTYIPQYQGWYIGGDDVGWSIDESLHTNGTTLTYSFDSTDPYLGTNSKYRSKVLSGAYSWRETVTITNKSNGTGTGLICTYNDPTTFTVAKFCEYSANSSGHLTSWKIKINRFYSITPTTIAHEFGHAIGLNDLYASKSSNKLMYAYADGTASGPTSSDMWGAKVITGVHTAHSWDYKYYGTNSNGNTHIKYCKTCNGLSTVTEACIYNSSNVCKKCGVPYGIQPYSFHDPFLGVEHEH